MELGYSLAALRQVGLVTALGYDAYVHRIVFPLEGNLYGRSISPSAPPHRFLPGTKGGLYCWEQARHATEVILVEGLFDYASLWQAGFRNVTCAMGTHLNGRQFRQLCERPRTVYLAFDADTNGSGQSAAQSLACRLKEQGLNVRTALLPDRHDPNSFFLHGGNADQFRSLLLLDYVRFQSSQQPRPAGSTINDRVALADRAPKRVPRRSLPKRTRVPSAVPPP
jgi:DNA primase